MEEESKIIVRRESGKWLILLENKVIAEFERHYEARAYKEQLLILPDDIRKEVLASFV